MKVFIKPQKYPILSYGDMIDQGIRFQIVSSTVIPFYGKGVWTISQLDKSGVPEYSYSVYRIQDTSRFEFEDEGAVDAEQMGLIFVFDRQDKQYKFLVFSSEESPEFMSVIMSCNPFNTEYFIRKACPDDPCRYYSTTIEQYEYDVYLGEDEQGFVEKNFKKKSLKQIRLMEQASSFELNQQNTRQLLN